MFHANGITWSSSLWTSKLWVQRFEKNPKSVFFLEKQLSLSAFVSPGVTLEDMKGCKVLRHPSLILSSLTDLSRWSYISNGKKKRWSSTWCGDAKLGFDEFNIASNIPKVLSFKGCYWLSTLLPVIVTKVTSCFAWFGCVSLTSVSETVLMF